MLISVYMRNYVYVRMLIVIGPTYVCVFVSKYVRTQVHTYVRWCVSLCAFAGRLHVLVVSVFHCVCLSRRLGPSLTPTLSVQVLVFTALLASLLYPPVDAIPREFYCYRMCRNALNKCMEKSCKGKFPALVPVECLAKHTDCSEKCGFMSKMLKFPLDSEKPPVRLRLVE